MDRGEEPFTLYGLGTALRLPVLHFLRRVPMEKQSQETKLLYTQCMFCGKTYRVQEAKVSGISHGPCEVCEAFWKVDIEISLALRKARDARPIDAAWGRRVGKLIIKKLAVKRALAFRKWAIENRGLKIRFAN
jgi:hypothetical protein